MIGTDETWAGINSALKQGNRGLPSGSSLAQMQSEHRRVRNQLDLPQLTISQILIWADEYNKRTGDWPNAKSGQVFSTDEKWSGIDGSLRAGRRGLLGGSSMAQLLAEQRGVRNTSDLTPLNIPQILTWVDEHKAAAGCWPNQQSGQVTGTDETWARINNSLSLGLRGLSGGFTLAQLLAQYRGVRNIMDLPPLNIPQILRWADEHNAATGEWPKHISGPVASTDETWSGINHSLYKGGRGLTGGSSLATLLADQRGVRNHLNLPLLTIEQILKWADAHRERTGDWPNRQSGQVPDTVETWNNIHDSLSRSLRGLSGGSTLAQLLSEHRGVRNHMDLPPLTIEQILEWASAHRKRTGDLPNMNSGVVCGTDETWVKIHGSLRKGYRGLPGDSSLAQLLAQHRSVPD